MQFGDEFLICLRSTVCITQIKMINFFIKHKKLKCIGLKKNVDCPKYFLKTSLGHSTFFSNVFETFLGRSNHVSR